MRGAGGGWATGQTVRLAYLGPMTTIARITSDLAVTGGRPCIRRLRVTVGTVVGLIASGRTIEDVLSAYPYLERDDVFAALAYAASRDEAVDGKLGAA